MSWRNSGTSMSDTNTLNLNIPESDWLIDWLIDWASELVGKWVGKWVSEWASEGVMKWYSIR